MTGPYPPKIRPERPVYEPGTPLRRNFLYSPEELARMTPFQRGLMVARNVGSLPTPKEAAEFARKHKRSMMSEVYKGWAAGARL